MGGAGGRGEGGEWRSGRFPPYLGRSPRIGGGIAAAGRSQAHQGSEPHERPRQATAFPAAARGGGPPAKPEGGGNAPLARGGKPQRASVVRWGRQRAIKRAKPEVRL